ncbi:MAG TPA: hypothetical protein VMZ92_16390 [Planctomycetota bacterium]|nr:hypothetical protein [Planctomycetota bacterium]
MDRLKISIIGGGSVYAALMLRSLALACRRGALGPVDLALMDIAEERMTIMARLGEQMASEAGADVDVTHTTELERALDGAHFVITTFRVGGLEGRLADETLPLEHHMLGQETVGAGGTFLALRTVPAVLEVATKMERLCADAWLVNYTNPANFIVDAVRRRSNVKVVGLCDGVLGILRLLEKLLNIETSAFAGIDVRVAGVNHCTWTLACAYNGRDLYPDVPRLIREVDPARLTDREKLAVSMFDVLGILPGSSAYTRYFWDLRTVLDEFTNPAFTPKARRMMDHFEEAFRYFAEVEEGALTLEKHVGDLEHGDQAVRFIEAVTADLREMQVVNVPNHGTVANLPDDAIVEVPGVVGRDGVTPVPVGAIPKCVIGKVRSQLDHAELSVDAALSGDPKLVVQAVLAHPDSTTFGDVVETVKDLAAAHRAHLNHMRF